MYKLCNLLTGTLHKATERLKRANQPDTLRLIVWTSLLVGLGLPASWVQAEDGNALYKAHCGTCHDMLNDPRVPNRFSLSRMNPLALLTTMQTGAMRVQAAGLSEANQRLLVESLTQRKLEDLVIPEAAYCSTKIAPITQHSQLHWSGWGGDKHASGYAKHEHEHLTKDNVAQLKLKWAFAFPGVSQARSQPAVLGDVLYVGGAEGSISALDVDTGCIYWRVNTSASIRGAIVIGEIRSETRMLYAAAGNTQVYALNAANGSVVWKQRVGFDALHSVTGTPAYHDGKLYVPISSIEVGVARLPTHECCRSSGGVVALATTTGNQLWQMRTTGRAAQQVGVSAGKAVFAPSGAPVWASPTVDAKRQLLYLGTGENYSRPATLTSDAILALDLDSGDVVWSYQATPDDAWHIGCDQLQDYAPCDNPGPDLDFGMSPMIVRLASGKEILVAGQKSAVVYAFDPDQKGKLLWKTRVGKGSALGGIHWGLATDHQQVYVSNADRPAVIKDVNPGTLLAPGIYALNPITGQVQWRTPTPGPSCTVVSTATTREQRARLGQCLTANSAAPSVIDDIVFAGDLYGVFRAYASDNGDVLWEFPTDRKFEARNAIPAKGGSIDGPGPVIANGRVFVNSGYGSFGQIAGNVLLAFEIAKSESSAE